MIYSQNLFFISRDVLFHEIFFLLSITTTDFIDPFVLGVDTTTEGGLDNFVTLVSIPNLQVNSSEPCIMSNPNSFPSATSNHDSLPSDSTMLSYYVPIVVTNPSANPPPIRRSTRVHKTPVYL